jgi:tRNA modification GTPase
MDRLRAAIALTLTGKEALRESAAISNVRHIGLLKDARAAMVRARAAVGHSPEEIVLLELQGARQAFDEVVGVRTSDDVLKAIFERFCIGK